MRSFAAAILLAALFLQSHDAFAQFPGGRYRSPRDDTVGRNRERPGAEPIAADPWSALERELVSLKVDMKLRADQVDAWNDFERDVHAIALVDREQARRLLGLREKSDPPPTALGVIGGFADEERRRSEAIADLQRHLQALYDRLDGAQRAMLDRRIVQSQTEPLGR